MRQVTLKDETYHLAEELARRSGRTVGEVVEEAIRRNWASAVDPYAIIGCLDDEADLLEQIVEDAMRDRENRPLRLPDG